MHVLDIECRAADQDLIVAELWERGTLGITEVDNDGETARLRAFFEKETDISGLPSIRAAWRIEEERDWIAVAQSQWQSVSVGSRFFLVPWWSGQQAPAGRIRLEMQPGLACGTGWHAATQLALEALERSVKPGDAVLDLGTGSGLLSIAAARLGAGRVYACDIDPDAVPVARERFRSERVQASAFVGSVDAVREKTVAVVAANISAEALIGLAGEIRRALLPGGIAILSGFPESDLPSVRNAYDGGGEALEKDGWAALPWQAPS
ncbi:MAG: 50S ribosomal protein L11 methyltransferase [Bryobacteraceae bacterium]